MTAALFPLAGTVDAAGVEWAVGSLDDTHRLLAEHHYLGPIRSGGASLVVVGLLDEEPVACQVWRLPTSRMLPADGSWLELSRWCLTAAAGENAGTRQHRYAVQIIRRRLPGVAALVSYSDPSHGHTGALYRACNWRWCPTWLRLRPPPTGHGAWQEDVRQEVKDRWVFPLRARVDLSVVTTIGDPGAVRHWRRSATDAELRWAVGHPELGRVA